MRHSVHIGLLLFFFTSFTNVYSFVTQDSPEVIELKNRLSQISLDSEEASIISGELAWRLRGLNLPEALKYGIQATEIAQKLNNDKLTQKHLSFVGVIYRNFGDYASSLNYYLQSYAIAERTGDKEQLAFAYNNIGEIYSIQKNYENAEEYIRKAIKLFTELNHPVGMGYAWLRLGEMYFDMSSFRESENALLKSYEIRNNDNNYSGLSSTLERLARLYIAEDKLDSALSFAQRSIDIKKEHDPYASTVAVKTAIAEIYLKKNDYDKALEVAQEAYEKAKFSAADKRIAAAAGVIADIYAQKKDFTQAYIYRKKQIDVINELNTTQADQIIDWVNSTLQYEKQKIELKQIENQIQAIFTEAKGYAEEKLAKTYIASLDGYKLDYNKTYRKGNTFKFYTRNLGKYKLSQDFDAPRIYNVNFVEGKNLKNQSTISVYIADNLSGIDTYNGYLNGEWVLMEYDYKTKKLIHRLDDNKYKEGRNDLKIIVTDDMQNSTTFESFFFMNN